MDILKFKTHQPYQKLTISVVAPGNFIGPLTEALQIENQQNYKDRLFFNFCEHIDECIRWIKDHGSPPDFIAIVVDSANNTGIEDIEDNIRKVDSVYSQGGRIAIVNGACSIKQSEMALGVGHLNILCQKYSMLLINGDVLIPEKCLYLASRILKLATSVCGLFTGVPVVLDVPGYKNARD